MCADKILFYILCFCNGIYFTKGLVVMTTSGPIRGRANTYGNTCYNSYEGIPYAEPPIGDLRFRPPVPKKPWDCELDATTTGYVCPQPEYIHTRSEMNENCLFLNVYVPVTNSTNLLPVFINIHDGYYIYGSGNPKPIYGPQLILEKNFIVVTINFRLGALGFLSLSTEGASGNAGLKDIVLALRWINDNIIKFGGDPNTKCIMGDGSGAGLVHYLTLTNGTEGLFQSVILNSGSAVGYRDLQLHPKENAKKLARQLGIECNDDSSLLENLKLTNAFSIVDAQQYIIENDPRRAFALADLFAPCVETPSPVSLITRKPLDVIRSEGLIQKVPVISGFNLQEGLEIFSVIKNNPTLVDKLNENFELCIPSNIQYPRGSPMEKELAASIRDFYFDGGNISIFNTQNYINLISDTAYIYGMDSWIKMYKLNERSSVLYYYIFGIDGELNWFKLLEDITYPGPSHADNLGYIFVTNVTEAKLQDLNSKSRSTEDSIINYITNLTVYGNPTPPCYGGFQWIKAGAMRQHLLYINSPKNVCRPPMEERIAFWYRAYAKYYEYERSCSKTF